MTQSRAIQTVGLLITIAGLSVAGHYSRGWWMPLFQSTKAAASAPEHGSSASEPVEKIFLSPQAQNNLRLTSERLKPDTYWKTLELPGTVVGRPGLNEQVIVAPVTSVVSRIHREPGEVVRPGEALFTLQLLSESLQLTQTELFKTTQEVRLGQEQRKRLAAAGAAIPESRILEVDNQIARSNTAIKAYRHELQTRGLTAEQMDGVAEGKFVTELTVAVPSVPDSRPRATAAPDVGVQAFEVHQLKVEMGQHVQTGQTLCVVANHESLFIEGRAFPDEAPLLEGAVAKNWPVTVDFLESTPGWPELDRSFVIRNMTNVIDPDSRTFAFMLPLANQARVIERDGRKWLLWRFRPGEKVRLHVRVERLDNVFIVPTEAVVREGPNAFVFRQNSDTFERKAVHVLARDRTRTVFANDGSVMPGVYIAQTGAVQINRMLKSASSAVPKGFHVHADGSLHKNEDEGK